LAAHQRWSALTELDFFLRQLRHVLEEVQRHIRAELNPAEYASADDEMVASIPASGTALALPSPSIRLVSDDWSPRSPDSASSYAAVVTMLDIYSVLLFIAQRIVCCASLLGSRCCAE